MQINEGADQDIAQRRGDSMMIIELGMINSWSPERTANACLSSLVALFQINKVTMDEFCEFMEVSKAAYEKAIEIAKERG